MMLPRIAAVTMAYNEPDFVGLWAAHYGAEVGARNCFVVDHGSDDGSLEAQIAADVGDIGRAIASAEAEARRVSHARHREWLGGLFADSCKRAHEHTRGRPIWPTA